MERAASVYDKGRLLSLVERPSACEMDDLHRRMEQHFRGWCRERGIDYDALSEDEFAELVERAIRQVRGGK